MKKETVKFFLIASLALNLAFIGAGIYRWADRAGSVELKKEGILQPYKLNGDQKKSMEDIVTSFRVKLAGNKGDVLEKRIDIIELLGNPEFETEALEDKLLELNEIENELNYEFVSTLLEINRIMDPEQWLKFLYNLSKSWFFAGSPGEV